MEPLVHDVLQPFPNNFSSENKGIKQQFKKGNTKIFNTNENKRRLGCYIIDIYQFRHCSREDIVII